MANDIDASGFTPIVLVMDSCIKDLQNVIIRCYKDYNMELSRNWRESVLNDWLNEEDFESIQTPFDIENILRADEKLFAQWKRKPFYLDIDEHGDVVVRYVYITKGWAENWLTPKSEH